MHAWEQIQITVDYIEKNLPDDLKIDDLAKLASLSQFYYQRLFKSLVKKPVNEYIKLRRLAKASEILQKSEKRILDIALDYVFSYHETFLKILLELHRNIIALILFTLTTLGNINFY
ncbi:helix-turn-helix domain-containing protein [Anaerovorax odorimutans]|uniref:helix-turn-helix domain-containing protein n=1 Tax=Anaerovorax odorimutans TaxID=109327 RepID=UPI0003F90CB8|nr:helix-turn-helix domain-containing protein [Anaerovorax odorimutans]